MVLSSRKKRRKMDWFPKDICIFEVMNLCLGKPILHQPDDDRNKVSTLGRGIPLCSWWWTSLAEITLFVFGLGSIAMEILAEDERRWTTSKSWLVPEPWDLWVIKSEPKLEVHQWTVVSSWSARCESEWYLLWVVYSDLKFRHTRYRITETEKSPRNGARIISCCLCSMRWDSVPQTSWWITVLLLPQNNINCT